MAEQGQFGLTDEMLAMEAEFNKRAQKERTTLFGLIKYIRDQESLRDFVTVETVPLNPLVKAQPAAETLPGRRALVHVLLSSIWDRDNPKAIPVPWAYALWEWPSRRLLGFLDLTPFAKFPEVALTPQDLVDREFCDSIERVLNTGGDIPRPSPALESLYNELLGRLGAPPDGHRMGSSGLGGLDLTPPKAKEPFSSPLTKPAADAVPPAKGEATTLEPMLVAPPEPLTRAPQTGQVAPSAPETDLEARSKVAEAIGLALPAPEEPQEPSVEDTQELRDFLKKID